MLLKLDKSTTSFSVYSSASPCQLHVRSLRNVLKSSKISGNLLLKYSQDPSKLQTDNWQVEEAVQTFETDVTSL